MLYDCDNIINLLVRQRFTRRDVVPFRKAFAAAGTGGVLGDEDRVVPHRRLFAVVGRVGIRQPGTDKIAGVFEYRRQTLLPEILLLLSG